MELNKKIFLNNSIHTIPNTLTDNNVTINNRSETAFIPIIAIFLKLL